MAATSYKDRISETSTFTGGGTVALLGAINGYASFTRFNASQSGIPVLIEAIDATNSPTGEWEVALCTLSADRRTLTRNSVRDSSNDGATVSFAAGTKRVSVVDDGTSIEGRAVLAAPNTFTAGQTIASAVPQLTMHSNTAASPTVRWRDQTNTTTWAELVVNSGIVGLRAGASGLAVYDITGAVNTHWFGPSNFNANVNAIGLGKSVSPLANTIIAVKNTNRPGGFGVIQFNSYNTDGTGMITDAAVSGVSGGGLWLEGKTNITFAVNAVQIMQLLPAGLNIAAGKVLTVPDDPYGAPWNGSLEVPTKNAVYDQFYSVQGALDNRVLKAGDTMTGALTIAPTTGNAALTLTAPAGGFTSDLIVEGVNPLVWVKGDASSNYSELRLSGAGQTSTIMNYQGLLFDVISGSQYNWRINNTSMMTLSATSLVMHASGTYLGKGSSAIAENNYLTLRSTGIANTINFLTANTDGSSPLTDAYLMPYRGGTFYINAGSSYIFRVGGTDKLTLDTATAAFVTPVTVPDQAYGAGWNGSTQVPTKNAVYDQLETLATSMAAYLPLAGGTLTGSLISKSATRSTAAAADQLLLNHSNGDANSGFGCGYFNDGAYGGAINAIAYGNGGPLKINPSGGPVTVYGATQFTTGTTSFGITGGGVSQQTNINLSTTNLYNTINCYSYNTDGTGQKLDFSIQSVRDNYITINGLMPILLRQAGVTIATVGTTGLAIAAGKTLTVPDEAYGAAWDGKLDVPTKNAVYDKLASVDTAATAGLATKVSKTGDTMSGDLINQGSLIASNALVGRGGGAGAEGGQLVLGFSNNASTTITGQANNTWNMDVLTGDILRLFVQLPGPVVKVAFTANPTTGRVEFTDAPLVAGSPLMTTITSDARYAIVASPNAFTGANTFASSGSIAAPGTYALEVKGTGGTNAAFIAFHRPSISAFYAGLDSDGKFRMGGWGWPTNTLTLDSTGILTATNFIGRPSGIAAGVQGETSVLPGTATNAGNVSFFAPGGTRAGYIGNADASNLYLVAEGSRGLQLNGVAVYATGPIYAQTSRRVYQQGATAAAIGIGGEIHVSTAAPSGGTDGDIWLRY